MLRNHIEIIFCSQKLQLFFNVYGNYLPCVGHGAGKKGIKKGWKMSSLTAIFFIDSRTIVTYSILQCELIGFWPFISPS